MSSLVRFWAKSFYMYQFISGLYIKVAQYFYYIDLTCIFHYGNVPAGILSDYDKGIKLTFMFTGPHF